MDETIQQRLRVAANRRASLQIWKELAIAWGAAAILGLLVLAGTDSQSSWLPFLIVASIGLGGVLWVAMRPRPSPDWHQLARAVEKHFPELDGRLLTGLESGDARGESPFLRWRLKEEVLRHSAQNRWEDAVPDQGLRTAQGLHWLALVAFVVVLWQLRSTSAPGVIMGLGPGGSIQVSPGDTTIERGSSLVVLARFDARRLPSGVELVSTRATDQRTARIPLMKTLGDPVFGASVPEVGEDLTYHIEYGKEKTREYRVTVYEHPRLERSDAELRFPEYTGVGVKRVENTRRITAVEGTHATLKLSFNKAVASAKLVSREHEVVLELETITNQPAAVLQDLALKTNLTFTLQLVDADGRTNKNPEQFVFEVAQNRKPEIRLTAPRGDTRPSALEEVTFSGTVWDDFGLERYGLGYSLGDQEPVFIELGGPVKGKEKQTFSHLLRLETLGVKPDDFVTWFVWADDLGPDGKERRTTSDLFFGEVRPFDEVFREGQGGGGGEGQMQGGGGQQGPELSEIQKNILNGTWNLRRSGARPVPAKDGPGNQGTNESSSASQSRFETPQVSRDDLRRILQSRPRAFGQATSGTATPRVAADGRRRTIQRVQDYTSDLETLRAAQEQALSLAEERLERQSDPKTATLLRGAIDAMKKALSSLDEAKRSPEKLAEALAAEQGAYQALLKLQEHEYQVQRNRRNQGQSGNSRQQQMQQQLDEMELTQSEDRYETQRQAQSPETTQQRETQQALSRLQELARRQQDLNDQFKELQSALQETTNQEKQEELRRQLKKLQEEEQQLLSDLDEMRQRMNRPENQSRMADQQRRLEQTREQVRRAAEAAEQGSASQALAAGARAQQQLQDLRDDLKKESSGQFSEEIRKARSEARELARNQEEILKRIEKEESRGASPLSGSPERNDLMDRVGNQRQRLTNLVDQVTQMYQQADATEPLLARNLSDSLRKFSQESTRNLREAQSDLLNRGQMTRSLLDQLNVPSTPDSAKLMDISSEMMRQDFLPQAKDAAQRTRGTLEDLKRGIEQAAESVIGDDTEALRMAEQELKRLSDQLGNEIARSQTGNGMTNQAVSSGTNASANGEQAERTPTSQSQNSPDEIAQNGSRATQGSDGQNAQGPGRNQGNRGGVAGGSESRRAASPDVGGGEGGDISGSLNRAFDRLLDRNTVTNPGPITGEDYAAWTDRLRNVEELIDDPELRGELAGLRERARRMRQDFKRDRQKPDWAVVRLEVMQPMVETRQRLLEELARRENKENMLPLDRDPVPTRFTDLVRRYYESLGKDK